MNSKALTIAGLIARGYVETPSTSRKYKVFARQDSDRKYIIGSAGALRVLIASRHAIEAGNVPISWSVSLTGTREHKAFQAVGKFAAKTNTVEQNDAMFAGEMANPTQS
ncbi:MAG: hypothetical protein JW388_1273 [Nitrospira sp.]|nr:hypothetical protein [Nitrospira sp.]